LTLERRSEVSRGRRKGGWRTIRPLAKPLVLVSYRVFPATKNLKRYWDTFGRLPNVILPKTFNEKIQRRILFDRNPRLAVFSDKLLVRGYVSSRLGDGGFLAKVYAVVSSPSEIGSLDLPDKFVMKPNHASGLIKIVRDRKMLTPGELEKLATEWLGTNYYDVTQEWGYKKIRPRVIFEELLEVDGRIPDDYKFYCFRGIPRIVNVVRDRFVERKINSYDMNLELLPVKMYGCDNFDGPVRPSNFESMTDVARRLSSGTDFLRVDLYDVNGRIVVGELTNYVSNGRVKFVPSSWDSYFGALWK
jgi:hypothetical protein